MAYPFTATLPRTSSRSATTSSTIPVLAGPQPQQPTNKSHRISTPTSELSAFSFSSTSSRLSAMSQKLKTRVAPYYAVYAGTSFYTSTGGAVHAWANDVERVEEDEGRKCGTNEVKERKEKREKKWWERKAGRRRGSSSSSSSSWLVNFRGTR